MISKVAFLIYTQRDHKTCLVAGRILCSATNGVTHLKSVQHHLTGVLIPLLCVVSRLKEEENHLKGVKHFLKYIGNPLKAVAPPYNEHVHALQAVITPFICYLSPLIKGM